MQIYSFFIYASLLASLGSSVLATPDKLYRGDPRGPTTIKGDGGFKARGFNNPEGTVFEHVEGTLKHPMRDPFIATTEDIDFSKEHTPTGYVYTLDSDKIKEKIHDVKEEYDDADKKYGHSKEKEFAVEHLVPWDAVTKVEKKNKDGDWKTIKMPTKRAIEFPDEDVFVD